MFLYIRITLIVLGLNLLNFPLLAADDEHPSSATHGKEASRKRKAGDNDASSWISNIKFILDILNDPNKPPSERIKSAKQRIQDLFYTSLPGAEITKDNGFWQKIIFQDLNNPSNADKSISTVKGKLTKLIKDIESNPGSSHREEKKPRNDEPPSSQKREEKEESNQPPHVFSGEPHAAGHSPYQLISSGPEERWRWRNNFTLLYAAPNREPKTLDFSQIHQDLWKIRRGIEQLNSKYMQTDSSNVLVPAISVIYETKGGQIEKVTDYLPNVTLRGIAENHYVSFLSGFGAKDLPIEFKHNFGNFHLMKGDSLGVDQNRMKEALKNFYLISGESPLNNFRNFILDILQNPPKSDEVNFGTYFYHSEQWLINYLSLPVPSSFELRGSKLKYGNLCAAIIQTLHQAHDIKEVLEVIFHIESTHDICDVCSPTLSVFLEKLNESKNHIIGLLQKLSLTEKLQQKFAYMKGVTISPNIGFFIVTSSNRADIAQARLRQYYTQDFSRHKHERRKEYGIDQRTNEGLPTEINPENPYLYIQVPIDQEGKALPKVE